MSAAAAAIRSTHACVARSERRGERGLTLVEVIVTVAIIALMTTAVAFGSGAVANARVRSSTSMIAGAIRVAYGRASATSKSQRLVFDLDHARVILEESAGAVLVRKNDAAGGAEAATAEEREAIAQADRITKGPRAPRARFNPVKAVGFEVPDTNGGRPLGRGVKFRRVETGHSPEGQTTGRAYLYFWPGGRTERAVIQVEAASAERPEDAMTLVVSPLTGKVRVLAGARSLDPPRDDGTSSERDERAP